MTFSLKRLLRPSGKNLRFTYIAKGFIDSLEPSWSKQRKLESLKPLLNQYGEEILRRVNYCCQLQEPPPYHELTNTVRVRDIKHQGTNYDRDFCEYSRFFPSDLFVDTAFGDNCEVPKTPSIVKSRPIYRASAEQPVCTNANAVMLNLDKVPHFTFVDDNLAFGEKVDQAIFRGAVYQAHRRRFIEQFFGSQWVDCGDTGKDKDHPEWSKPKISLYAHLKHKFVISLEGNDVASNLKWVMNSNSIAVMPRPKYETWFLEGTLLPNVHYIEIEDDYSDLGDKLEYYASHTKEAQEIIDQAHQHVAQFLNPQKEDLISLLVLDRYFKATNPGFKGLF